jgi:transmembrane 9 superfamily protein 2/4
MAVQAKVPCLCLALLVGPTAAFYLPGIAPKEYDIGAPLDLKVNKLTSSKAQLPYSFYSLDFCKPPEIKKKKENLGELLAGDDIENSPYDVKMQVNETCRELCKRDVTDTNRRQFKKAIDEQYMVNWIIDNLPAATKYIGSAGPGMPEEQMTLPGSPVGYIKDGRYYLHNHVVLKLSYHSNTALYQGYRFVAFEVEPYSLMSCRDTTTGPVDVDGQQSAFTFTYDVQWQESSIRWVSRWDIYLTMTGGEVHWFSILNSLLIVVLLAGMVAMIMLRTLFRDIAKYNELATEEEAKEETGWKLVHADVFRAPPNAKLLAVCVGSGMQLLGMAVVVLAFALLGFLSPAHRGSLLQSMMLLFTFMGVFGGYTMALLYKVFGKDEQRTATLLMAFLFPGAIFAVFFFLNLMIWHQNSSGAVPLMTMIAMLVLWFGVSVPLVFLGAHGGFQRAAIELPVRVSPIARGIPTQGLMNNAYLSAAVGGILPFGAVFTEVFFIMSSLWHHRFYYLFGFLGIVLALLIFTCAEISIALTYFQLTSEDYNWWWRAFFTSGASAGYLFAYSVLYFNTRLAIDTLVATALYFGYMAVMSLLFFLMTGSIGLMSSFFFVRAIYGSIKID